MSASPSPVARPEAVPFAGGYTSGAQPARSPVAAARAALRHPSLLDVTRQHAGAAQLAPQLMQRRPTFNGKPLLDAAPRPQRRPLEVLGNTIRSGLSAVKQRAAGAYRALPGNDTATPPVAGALSGLGTPSSIQNAVASVRAQSAATAPRRSLAESLRGFTPTNTATAGGLMNPELLKKLQGK